MLVQLHTIELLLSKKFSILEEYKLLRRLSSNKEMRIIDDE